MPLGKGSCAFQKEHLSFWGVITEYVGHQVTIYLEICALKNQNIKQCI